MPYPRLGLSTNQRFSSTADAIMAPSTEGAELKLVSSIRYKLAAVSSDEKKLSEVLQSQLTSLLEKAGSQHKAVREDVNPHCPG
jgi:hypothetical protein